MSKDWTKAFARLNQKDADGQYPMAITGQETHEEIVEIAMTLHQNCPAKGCSKGCPFDFLTKLSDAAMRVSLSRMKPTDLISLFMTERECRKHALDQDRSNSPA